MIKAKLACKTGQLEGAEFEILKEATIGRDPENTIVLDLDNISGRHARIYYDEDQGGYFLEDLKSLNGTELDGVKVTSQKALGKLHVITLANVFDFVFLVTPIPNTQVSESTGSKISGDTTAVEEGFLPVPPIQQEDPSKLEAASTSDRTLLSQDVPIDPQLPPEVKSAGDRQVRDLDNTSTMFEQCGAPEPGGSRTKLKVRGKEGNVLTFDLKEGENLVGRSGDCQVCINDVSVSRGHAMVTVSSGKVLIRDLDSANHTFVENQRIDSEVELRPDVKVRFGTIEATLVIEKGL